MPAARGKRTLDARPGTRPPSPPVGIGFKPGHYRAILETRPPVEWFEVHAENYMVAGGPALRQLEAIRALCPVSLHAVGLSLGSPGPVDTVHLRRLGRLIDHIQPTLVSDHLAWCRDGDVYLPDLLPLPYTEEALGVVCDNVSRVQDAIDRTILIENPSAYLRHRDADMGEAEFLAALARRSGCGILLDVNNLYVSAANVGLDADAYLAALPQAIVGEIHVAGHKTESGPAGTVLIDDHGSPVADAVWRLYRGAVGRFGPIPTLVEWDSAVPPLETLVAEAAKARAVIAHSTQPAAHDHAA